MTAEEECNRLRGALNVIAHGTGDCPPVVRGIARDALRRPAMLPKQRVALHAWAALRPAEWLPVLTGPQMTALSCLYNTDGDLDMGGYMARPTRRLVELGLAEHRGLRWHRVTERGREAFLRLRATEDTREGAAARRMLARADT